jgi:RimJ/RimL family protein N-acetyltransferase
VVITSHLTLTSARLVLRPLQPDDLDLLVVLDRDPGVKQYIDGGQPVVRADVEAAALAALGHRWMAFDRQDDAFVGWFGARPTGPDERELGYRLRRAAWGRGLATEGARVIIETAFSLLGSRRVWAQTMAVNTRSRAVLERCGFRFVRTFHVDWADPLPGAEHGEVEYELLREPPDPA